MSHQVGSTRTFGLACSALALLVLALPAPVWAQAAADDQDVDAEIKKLGRMGPFNADLGDVAQIQVPAQYLFIGKAGLRKFNDLTQNIASPTDVGVLLPEDGAWFIYFNYNAIGYVKDDEKDKLDADALFKALNESNEAGNAERRKRGFPALHLNGWKRAPFYDPQTNNLTWALQCKNEVGGESINYEVRLLGRSGVMSANLVIDPDQLDGTLPTFNRLIGGYSYKPGQKYSEWRAGDKVAEYGLTALILGGAGALALKSGWLGKFAKVIIGGIVALVAGIGALLKKLFGGGSSRPVRPLEEEGQAPAPPFE